MAFRWPGRTISVAWGGHGDEGGSGSPPHTEGDARQVGSVPSDAGHLLAPGRRHVREVSLKLPVCPSVVHHEDMVSASRQQKERRWVVLGEDGRFVTLGRHSDPTEEEISSAEHTLRAQGLAGWLAVVEGNPLLALRPVLVMVRPLASPSVTFENGVEAFRARLAQGV